MEAQHKIDMGGELVIIFLNLNNANTATTKLILAYQNCMITGVIHNDSNFVPMPFF